MNFRNISSMAILVMSAWLAVSPWLFGYGRAHTVNALAVGLASIGTAIAGRRGALAWFSGSAALGVWLFFSLFVLPGHSAAVVVNGMIVATMMFGFGCVGAIAREPVTP